MSVFRALPRRTGSPRDIRGDQWPDRFVTGPGVGITSGTDTICKTLISRSAEVVLSTIVLDLTGLHSGATAGDIIGKNGTGVAYIARLSAYNGTPTSIRMTCTETPAGGDADIDLYSATEGTGVEDVAISTLTEVQLINAGSLTSGQVAAAANVPLGRDA